MNRSKVIVHMYVSIDGKIDGDYSSAISSSYYNDELFKLGNADANGRRTIQMYAAPGEVNLTPYSGNNIKYEDWIPNNLKEKYWSISFDRKGKCNWQSQYFSYTGRNMRAIEVVTEQADKRYLEFLQKQSIPYLVCGKDDINFEEAFTKLKEKFDLDTVAVCGGSVINGAVLDAGVVDEISLVIAPYVSGDPNEKGAFNTLGTNVRDQFAIKSIKKLDDGGLHLIFSKK